jgi:hypothetical protein
MESQECSILCLLPLSVWTHVDGLNDARVERTLRHKRMDIVEASAAARGTHEVEQVEGGAGGRFVHEPAE